MIKSSWVVIALAIATGTAAAQPGATEPQPPPPAGGEGPVHTVQSPVDLDALAAKVQAEAPTIETIARGTFNRARRAISVGPTVGAWGAAFPGPGDVDAALTLGVGVELFKVPVLPDTETLQALIVERFKAKLKDQLAARFAGREPEPLEAEAMAKQIYEEVRDEFLGLKNTRAKTLERPRLTVGFEANRLFGAERWLGRTRVGIGIWKFTLGISAAVGRACRGGSCDDKVKLFSGPEIIVHALTSRNPRASVVDGFVRFDLQATGRGTETYDQLVLGVRYLLDVI